MRLEETFRGSQEVLVYKGRNKEPHFVITGADPKQLSKALAEEYLEGADWTDKDSPGWVTPRLRCDGFLASKALADAAPKLLAQLEAFSEAFDPPDGGETNWEDLELANEVAVQLIQEIRGR